MFDVMIVSEGILLPYLVDPIHLIANLFLVSTLSLAIAVSGRIHVSIMQVRSASAIAIPICFFNLMHVRGAILLLTIILLIARVSLGSGLMELAIRGTSHGDGTRLLAANCTQHGSGSVVLVLGRKRTWASSNSRLGMQTRSLFLAVASKLLQWVGIRVLDVHGMFLSISQISRFNYPISISVKDLKFVVC
jgi:hypothetical protein